MRPASPLIAFAVASLGIAIFSSMDAVMKGLVIGLGAYNALTWRMLAGTVVSGVPYALSPPRWPARAVMRIHIVRGLVSAVMAYLFFWGLGRVPMAQPPGNETFALPQRATSGASTQKPPPRSVTACTAASPGRYMPRAWTWR